MDDDVTDDDVRAIDDAARAMQIFFGAAERRELARVEADLASTMPTMRPATARRRQRKPNIDKLIAKAKAAGATSVLVEGVEMRFGNAASGNGAATDVDRELAEFEARHEA
jgi:hypothetical protein